MTHVGRLLIVAGAALIVAGLLVLFGGRLPLLGRLPGDFRFRIGETTVYLPLATCLLVSLLLSALLTMLLWFFGKPTR